MKTLVSLALCLALVCGLVAPVSACNVTHAAFVGSHFRSFAFVTPFVPTVAVTSFVPAVVAAPAVSYAAPAVSTCSSAAVASAAVVASPVVSAVAVPFVQTAVIASPFIVRERFFRNRAVIVRGRRAAVVVGGRGRVVQRMRTVTRGR